MSATSFTLTLIDGMRVFNLEKICPRGCGIDADIERINYSKVDSLKIREKLEEEGFEKRRIDFPLIYQNQRACLFASDRPCEPLYIYERNDLALQEDWQVKRSLMVELAYKSEMIFSISFMPVHPELRQTWCMQKHFFKSRIPPSGGYDTIIRKCVIKGDGDSSLADEIKGMLRPYCSYHSMQCMYDHHFENLPIETLNENSFQEAPDDLKVRLNQIGRIFKKDPEAQQMALIYFQPDHPTQKICYRVFDKA